ncbi:putative 33 kDa inner dynein arm light chain,axonemal [Leishmania braziliensis MHOM/BR/75/M2904]|uniref:33 kDa inner dynein arm light chain,axonemal n=2 Tax=Leishmania braziliensis TaxID=5660 RepID=A4HLH3_LEIBR|nr:putative 33 kDa inner dynein arm light chain,axonemal [Leishmania braziliensis MHOM/BR/75/M2904]CAJ2479429.1 unnamed protein product [Leishmania braziliensis]CAM40669.2 putative 33 kDa inner dynein arm light chain,axonemal [Leishmania braziliensis MHOM/BR/75/M2904]SYZ69079.1 Axonemal_inner_arm_dynein_light_chain [Leishmania braziliensis MHOM/BR/75/M2904]
MDEVDLTTPLLQLNPPVLVRTTSGEVGAIDLVALRRTTTGIARTTPAVTSSPHPLTAGTAALSLAARRLHDAKRTAQNVYRQTRDATVPTMPGVSLAPLSRAQTIHDTGMRKCSLAGTARSREATTNSAAAASMGNSGHRPAADVRRDVGSAPPSPTAGLTPSRGAAPHAFMQPAATAAAASADSQRLSVNMPYLMRHVHDTGALLDVLFPIQHQSTAASPRCTGSPSGVSSDSKAAEEDAVQLVSVQTVSAAPAFREDVMALHGALRKRLEARRARPTGLCLIRRELYRDLFSELVRQVTVEEPARGLLLARVREEAERALQVHAALLREGERFVAGKLLQDTHDALVLEERLAALQQEKVVLEVRKHELLEARKAAVQCFEEERQLRHAQQQDELKYLRHANQQLSLRLKMETERESTAGELG